MQYMFSCACCSLELSSAFDELSNVELLVVQCVLAVRHTQNVHFRRVAQIGQQLQQTSA